jgi:hypothetical protein
MTKLEQYDIDKRNVKFVNFPLGRNIYDKKSVDSEMWCLF